MNGATDLTITVNYCEGSCDLADELKGKTYTPREFATVVARIAADAPAGGAYNKCDIALRWTAVEGSKVCDAGEEIELQIRLDVKRETNSVRPHISESARVLEGVLETGKFRGKPAAEYMVAHAREWAHWYREAVEAFDATREAGKASNGHADWCADMLGL